MSQAANGSVGQDAGDGRAKYSRQGQPVQLWFAWYPVQTDKGRRWLTRVWWYVEYGRRATRGGLFTVPFNRYRARLYVLAS